MRDLTFSKTSIKIRVTGGKMADREQPRSAFVVRGYDHLKDWYDSNLNRDNPDAWLFGDAEWPLQDSTLRMGLAKLARAAGVKKRVYSYIFRHGVGTKVYSKMPSEVARRVMGHKSGKMGEVYCHLDDTAIQNAMLEANGVEVEEQKKTSTGICPRCKHMNPLNVDICNDCGFALTLEAAVKVDEERKFTNEDIMNELKKMIVGTTTEDFDRMRRELLGPEKAAGAPAPARPAEYRAGPRITPIDPEESIKLRKPRTGI